MRINEPYRTRQKLTGILPAIAILLAILSAGCEEFFHPPQGLVVEKDDYYIDWSEYRSAEMGLYALQQNLVDQLVVLGELRADLMEITPSADRDLIEVYNHQISRDNRFASPQNFYKLIAACNSLINQLESAHPEVVTQETDISDYDRLYGEALSMRAWTYFNAVRIYGKVPYIWPSLTTVNEITEYVNTPGEFIDSVNIVFDPSGYYNDTTYMQPVSMQRIYLDLDQVIDTFTVELERKARAVGVVHNKDNDDLTWDVTVWNWYAYKALLGQMYLFQGDLVKAEQHFNVFMYNDDSETSNIKFGLDGRFAKGKWKNIFAGIDGYEHIYTLWFNKSFQQQHDLQSYFSKLPPNQYMIKPTQLAVHNWETLWDGMMYNPEEPDPYKKDMMYYGFPGDFHRGHGLSFVYMRGEDIMTTEDVRYMLSLKRQKLHKDVERYMEGVDTVLFKYTYRKVPYDQDANFIIYRASGIHLYYAEIYSRWQFFDDRDEKVRWDINRTLKIVNDGSYANRTEQMGVRGRVGFGGEISIYNARWKEDDDIKLETPIIQNDPFTNEITGYLVLNGLQEKIEYLENQVIEERARELAFEGERFYDLMRVAKRRGDPSYLADKVARKFSGAKAEEIRSRLMNEANWYVPFYE